MLVGVMIGQWGPTSSTCSSVISLPLGIYSRHTASYMSVLMPPGAMALTVILFSPKSDRAEAVS